uniref:RAP domain-containing protein n=1 Tax=Tetraselmis sp. GSL018 TaxID=582737 RepID=A0A061SD38_9CHLO
MGCGGGRAASARQLQEGRRCLGRAAGRGILPAGPRHAPVGLCGRPRPGGARRHAGAVRRGVALSLRGLVEVELFDALAERMLLLAARGAQLSPEDISAAAAACGAMGHAHPRLFRVLAGEALRQAGAMRPRHICSLAWASAELGHVDEALFSHICGVLEAGPDTFHAEALALLLWSLAVAQRLSPRTAAAVRDAVSRPRIPSTAALSQLYAAELGLLADHGPSAGPGLLEDAGVSAEARRAWLRGHCQAEDAPPGRRDAFAEIADVLRREGLSCQQQLLTEDGQVPVRLACFPSSEDKVAVEVYYSALCTSTEPRRPLGKMLLRRRLLEARGWRVAAINSEEWHGTVRAAGSPSGLHRLRAALLEARLGLSPAADGQPAISR